MSAFAKFQSWLARSYSFYLLRSHPVGTGRIGCGETLDERQRLLGLIV